MRKHPVFLSFRRYSMENDSKLLIIKTIHTLIWLFFNFVIFYMLYAAITGNLGFWLWVGYGIILGECVTLLIFKFFCPLTIIARRYSQSTEANFDIYLPNRLAKHNKAIYSVLFVIIIIITIYQLLN